MATTRPVTTRTGARLEQRVEVETPEQVLFEYTIAGVGSRAAAAILDYLLIVAVFLMTVLVFGAVYGSVARMLGSTDSPNTLFALLIIGQFVLIWGYYVLFEALWDGQTPGKRALKLRVVQDGGYSISFRASAVRNIVRVVDLLPGPYAVGMVSVIFSKTGKRLGDYAAGTIVVHERTDVAPAVVARAPKADDTPVSAALAEDEYEFLGRFLARRAELDGARRQQINDQLVHRLGDRIPAGPEPESQRLAILYSRERELRARGVAARSDTGAAREHHSLVAVSSERWRKFASALESARTRGLKRMSENEVADFVEQYREITTDLARLRTAARGRDSDAVYYVSRLVAGGHNLLYRRRDIAPKMVASFFFSAVPREIRRSYRPVALATLLLFGPMIAGHIAVVRNPDLAMQIVGPGMVERAETALQREERGGGYLPEAYDDMRGALMSSQIATNNVRVTFFAFAYGITAGIGTTLLLLFNGFILGAATGLFESHGALHLILAFVAPHGVLELSAICIAAGGGLLIGSAFLIPGAMTRREALVVRGRRAMLLLAGACLLLVVAGLIEGYVSPLNLPLNRAAMVSAITAVVMIVYLMGGRGSEDDGTAEETAYRDDRALSSM